MKKSTPGFRSSALIACMVVAISLTGCFSSTPDQDGGAIDPTPTPGTPPSTSPVPTTTPPPITGEAPSNIYAEFIDCQHGTYLSDMPREEAAAMLPDGYTPRGTTSLTAYLVLRLYDCASFVLNNETVIQPFSWAETKLTVTVNDTLDRGETMSHSYQLEWFIPDQRVVDAFGQHGFPVTLATVDVESTLMTITATIAVEGTTWYEVEGIFQPGASNPQMSSRLHAHRITEDGTPKWLVIQSLVQDSSLGPAAVTAHHGVIAGLSTTIEGTNTGTIGEIKATGSITVDQLEPGND